MQLLAGHLFVEDIDELLETLNEIANETQTTVQAFDADYVVSAAHLERALALADRAIDRGENVARDRAVEILCYAAGRRQINRALEMGLREGENRVVVLVDSVTGDETAEEAALDRLHEHIEEAAALGEFDEPTVRAFFDIGDAELAAVEGSLQDLVLERVALLDVEK
jgi:KEOPS complex subunit Cgi121